MTNSEEHALNGLKNQIKEKQKNDPHIAAKIASHALLEKIFSTMSDDKGLHVESAFAALGSLAGYACQQSALAQQANESSENSIMTIGTEDGNQYFYGDAINKPLLEDSFSVWSLIGGEIQYHDGKLPNIKDIIEHVSSSIGSPEFGVPRLPENHGIRYQPKECLKLWAPLKMEILDELPVHPNDWGFAYGLAIQSLLSQAKEVLPLDIAATIVMECAVSMSKVVLENIED